MYIWSEWMSLTYQETSEPIVPKIYAHNRIPQNPGRIIIIDFLNLVVEIAIEQFAHEFHF